MSHIETAITRITEEMKSRGGTLEKSLVNQANNHLFPALPLLTIDNSTLNVIDLTKNKIKSLKEVLRPFIAHKAPPNAKNNSRQDCNALCTIRNIERVEYPTKRKRKISSAMLSSLDEIANDEPSHNTLFQRELSGKIIHNNGIVKKIIEKNSHILLLW